MVAKTKKIKGLSHIQEMNESLKEIADRVTIIELKNSAKRKRADVWVSIASAVASASDCRKDTVPVNWADNILAEYDKRFTN